MVERSRRDDVHTQANHMKLSSFAFIAAVIGGSFLIPVLAEGKNPWIKAAESSEGDSIFVKDISCGGQLCEYDFSARGSIYKLQVNCNNWTMRPQGHAGSEFNFDWRPILPESIASAAAEYACNLT